MWCKKIDGRTSWMSSKFFWITWKLSSMTALVWRWIRLPKIITLTLIRFLMSLLNVSIRISGTIHLQKENVFQMVQRPNLFKVCMKQSPSSKIPNSSDGRIRTELGQTPCAVHGRRWFFWLVFWIFTSLSSRKPWGTSIVATINRRFFCKWRTTWDLFLTGRPSQLRLMMNLLTCQTNTLTKFLGTFFLSNLPGHHTNLNLERFQNALCASCDHHMQSF